ncbi:MarC family protein [Acidisphaera sp. L21]|uniref:MarC family protein n=1 Tax=Acidisphaera sp. L21 TaxID=1641851 RepID=UPI00131D616D|nr:MarC family protein [Acidisphaera sp. L21]
MNAAFAAFLLGFPALFSIVNPVSGAFIFRTRTVDRSHEERVRLARRVGAYSAGVMLVALWAGSYVLAFFGITLPALRCAGGIILALYAWSSLNAPERREARKAEQVDAAAGQDDVAFYPLTLPFTTGPGTISVAVALGSAHPATGIALIPFFIGMSVAALAVAALVWALYSASDQLSRLFGQVASRAITRLSAFFQLCIGVQILINGVTEILRPLLAHAP